MLAAGARGRALALDPGVDAPEPAPPRGPPIRRRTSAPGALMRFHRRQAGREVSIFASGSEVSLAVAAQKLLADKGHCGARRVGTLHSGSVRTAGRGLPQPAHRRRPGEDRRRSGCTSPGLGRHHWQERPVHRHDDVRRERALFPRKFTSTSALRQQAVTEAALARHHEGGKHRRGGRQPRDD